MHFSRFFLKFGNFREVFILYVINFVGRISEAAMVGTGGAQRPDLRVKEPTSGCAQCTGGHAQQNLLCICSLSVLQGGFFISMLAPPPPPHFPAQFQLMLRVSLLAGLFPVFIHLHLFYIYLHIVPLRKKKILPLQRKALCRQLYIDKLTEHGC
jgi:hypothetical protein